MDADEVIKLANAASQGKRPYFFENSDVDRLLAIVMAMAGELAVTRERLDTVERLLARRELLSAKDIDDFRPNTDEAQQRGQWQIEYLSRVLRIVQQEAEALRRGADAVSAEDVAREVARD